MEKIKVGIQGVKASFHHMAASAYFGNRPLELVEVRDFRVLAETAARGEVDYAVMAIENTIGGTILPNYGFIEEFGLKIQGEEYLRISMQLLALPGTRLADIGEVMSHPMALRQCMAYLKQHPHWKLTEVSDTADSARLIAEQQLTGVAAIAGRQAATVYGLDIVAPDIETDKQNYTRFLILSNRDENHVQECDKSSVRMILSHTPGSLFRALAVLNDYGLNLTKIQSVPIIGKPYEYAIHFDLEYSDYQVYKIAMEEISRLTIETKIMGIYRKGQAPVKV